MTETPASDPGDHYPGFDTGEIMLLPYETGQPAEGTEAVNIMLASMKERDAPPKADTLHAALAEQADVGITYTGIEDDPDLADIAAVLERVYGKETLDACLISKIAYHPDSVLVADNGKHYEVPAEDYATIAEASPYVRDHRVRAVNTLSMNDSPAMKRYSRLPIGIYSFEAEPLDDKDYLPEDADETERMRLYKQGTVVHEVGHNVYSTVLPEEARQEWDELVAGKDGLTGYARHYKDDHREATEQFSEALRLFATNAQYLKSADDAVDAFIRRQLPDMTPDSLRAA